MIFCSIFCSFYLKLDVLKNSPGYRPRQVCDFAQGDIRSRILGILIPERSRDREHPYSEKKQEKEKEQERQR